MDTFGRRKYSKERQMPSRPSSYSFEIPPQGLQELAEVASLADHLSDVQKALDQLGPTAGAEGVRTAVAGALKIDLKRADLVLRGLVSLRSLKGVTKLSAADLFDAVTDSLESIASADWRQRHLEPWKSARDKIIAVISQGSDDDVLSVRSKIRELTYLHENILLGSRLLTELRPVYNSAGDSIVNTVLTTTLLIRYRGHGRAQEMQFEMDLDDVSDLRAQCERAERKIATARRMFQQASWNLMVAGSPDQENAE
jgi:hypothetical protein